MKILSLKYKMHKLVNLVFYLIIFVFGFLLGFLGNKINFEDLLTNFLFIDNVHAEESDLTCTESENLFDVKDVLVNGVIYNGAIPSLGCEGNCLIVGGVPWSYVNYDIFLEPGTYYFWANKVSGSTEAIEVRILNEETQQLEWLYGFNTERRQLTVDKDTTIQFRFYSSIKTHASTEYNSVFVVKQICEEEKPKDVFVDIVNDNFYNFSKKIIGDLGEENYFVYDFITLGLISVCFVFFVLLVGYVIKKFLGG